jgi:hypothetical protein
MKATYPIKRTTIISNGQEREYISTTIVSEQIFNDLLKIGITPKKTWSMNILNIISYIPQQFIRDFLRGYFDGDGSITNSQAHPNKPSYINVSIAMPLSSGKALQKYLSSLNIFVTLQEDKRKYTHPFCNVCFFGVNKYVFLKWIYYDNCLCLQRKYDRALYYCYLIENNITNRSENKKAINQYNEFTQQND